MNTLTRQRTSTHTKKNYNSAKHTTPHNTDDIKTGKRDRLPRKVQQTKMS